MPATCAPLRLRLFLPLALLAGAMGCDGCDPTAFPDDGGWTGTNNDDAGTNDDDAGTNTHDAGGSHEDAGTSTGDDAGTSDDAGTGTGEDAGTHDDDAGTNTHDAGGSHEDAGTSTGDDASTSGGDAGGGGHERGPVVDAGTGPQPSPCVSGATGTHVLRFRWNGTTSGSTAWVSYETNTLPDTSRWKVGAYSQSFSYSPVFGDPYLGEGGLELTGTVFIDVELSTAGLTSVHNATLAIYGRSYNTTASGSFSWQTFSGIGAAPSGLVSNSAPYEWYAADVTDVLPAGDDGVLLRIRPGPPSNALVVNRVEICLDAS